MNTQNNDLQNSFKRLFASYEKGHHEGETKQCPKCGEVNKIWQYVEACNAILPCHMDCACSRQAKLEKQRTETEYKKTCAFAFSQLPKRYANYTFETWKGPKGTAYKLGTSFCERAAELIPTGQGFTIRGDLRIGKTFLLASIHNRLCAMGWRVLYLNHADALASMRPNSTRKNNEAFLMEQIKHAQVVVLDDVGTEFIKPWGISKTYDIIDYLYRNNVPLLCGTNLSKNQLDSYFLGEDGFNRITPRLLEMSPLVTLASPSHSGSVQAEAASRISSLMTEGD